MKRAFIMVLDSFGIGATEDAERFGDVGSDTMGHIAEACAKGEADNGRKGPLPAKPDPPGPGEST
jgi:phosphopentomutase